MTSLENLEMADMKLNMDDIKCDLGSIERSVRKKVESVVWVKVLALGNANVGKTCLIKHFCESKFSQCYHATVGVDYGFKVQNIKGIPLRVHLWDLSGDPQYYDVRNELYGGAEACFIVFDVTNRASFENLDNWIREIGKFGGLSSAIAVVGNKADLRNNKGCVTTAEARKWASSKKLSYYETSALSGVGVLKLFEDLLTTVVTAKKLCARPSTTA